MVMPLYTSKHWYSGTSKHWYSGVVSSSSSLAKTTRPSLSGVLPRERLFPLLDRGSDPGIIWLAGPPGSGKTTLAASYLDSRNLEFLWYQLDQGDNDIANFFYYMRQAAIEHSPEKGKSLPLLLPEYFGDLSKFTRRYFRDLFACLSTPFVIVFDSYEHVSPQSDFHEVIRDGLSEIPLGGYVIFVSRSNSPPAMARLRANQTLKCVGWDELRLTRSESDAITKLHGHEMSEEAMQQLYEKTQGWAAGLILMLEYAKSEGLMVEPPADSTPNVIFDYLAGEIFQNIDQNTQEFLLRTAYLPQMTASMAEELSGQEQAVLQLNNLIQNSYFVTAKQTPSETIYQYHPLLREFLLSKAKNEFGEKKHFSLQRKAADLLEEAGQIEDAVGILLETENKHELIQIIMEHAPTILAQGRGETLARWLEELPGTMLQKDPWMLYWLGTCRFPFAPRESRRLYERAFNLFKSQEPKDAKGMLLACSGIMDAILYEQDDLALLDNRIDEIEELVRAYPECLTENIEARVTCSISMALVLRQPHHPDVKSWVERTFAVSQSRSDPNLRMTAQLHVATAIMWTGHFSKALGVIESMRKLAQSPEVTPLSLTTLKNVESMYYMLRGEIEPCLEAVHDGQDICQSSGVHIWGYELLVHGVGGALGAGELDTAERLLKEMESHPEGPHRRDRCLYHYFSAWNAMLRHDTLSAFQHQKSALKLAIEVGNPFFEVLCRLSLAQVLFELGDARKGVAHLQVVHSMARNIHNRMLEFMCLMAYAQIALEHGRERSGLNSLRYALKRGRENGYVHFLWWQPEVITKLCARALEEGIETDYVRMLIRKRGLIPDKTSMTVQEWPWEFRIYTLGKFDVLKEEKPLGLMSKLQRKPMKLLKALVAFGSIDVNADRVADALWPHGEGDYAHQSLNTTLHRLRKLLDNDEAVLLKDGRLSLNIRFFWVDTLALEHALGDINSVFKRGSNTISEDKVTELAEKVLHLYQGSFMEDDDDIPQYISLREKLRSKFLRAISQLARYWEETDQWDKAVEYYNRGLEVDHLAEGLYRGLMVCFHKLNRRAEAIEVYNRCRKTLSAELDVEPSPETTEIYNSLNKEG